MISFDFEYYKPKTLSEAMECYHNLASLNKAVLYYSGGTEIISMARAESIKFDAVIDLKGIPECNVLSFENKNLVLGSTLTLTQIAETGHFPLLCETISRIADHTIQGKVTLGGNLAGTIKYREAILPLMITDCKVRIMTQSGLRQRNLSDVFSGRITLQKGEFLVQFFIDKSQFDLPYVHVKKTKMDKIDYPLITMAAIKINATIKAAVSGLGDAPILLPSELLSNAAMTQQNRIHAVLNEMDAFIISDYLGSKEYRVFVMQNILSQMFENLKGA